MNPNLSICTGCPLEQLCHEKLQPERINSKTLKRGRIHPKLYQFYIACRHYTCNEEGRKSARKALMEKQPSEFKIFDGSIVLAVVFGSKDKPTDIDFLRIVDVDGNVYSEYEDELYPTGVNINYPIPEKTLAIVELA